MAANSSESSPNAPAHAPILVSVQEQDFSIEAASRELRSAARSGADGALATFTGMVRDNAKGNLQALELEHYPGMTESSLRRICDDALTRWPLGGVSIIHRVGRLPVGDQIVFCAVLSAHRHAAFEACHYLMDHLKTEAPFWKKEIRDDGAEWIKSRQSDEAARKLWDAPQT